MAQSKEKWLLSLKKANDEYRKCIRDAIETALLQLMDKKAFCKIKITEVIQRAGVSRSAFYRNYSSLDEVLSEKINALCKRISKINEHSISDNWKAILTKIDENKETLKIVIKAGLESKILETMNNFFQDRTLKEKTYFYSLNGIIYNLILELCKGNLGEDLNPIILNLTNTTKNMLVLS